MYVANNAVHSMDDQRIVGVIWVIEDHRALRAI